MLRRAATFRTHTKTQNNNDVQRFSPTQSYGKESLSEETVARGKGLAMGNGDGAYRGRELRFLVLFLESMFASGSHCHGEVVSLSPQKRL